MSDNNQTDSVMGEAEVISDMHNEPEKAHKTGKQSKIKTTPRKVKTAKKRSVLPYPTAPFEDCLVLVQAINTHASGEKVRLLTLLKHLDMSPSADSTRVLITNSAKYGLTTGSYQAEWINPTELGKQATDPSIDAKSRLAARFKLAIERISPSNGLYNQYEGERLPSREVLQDALITLGEPKERVTSYVDLFIVNAKFLGIIVTIAGSETLIPIEQALEEHDELQNVGKDSVDISPSTMLQSPPQDTLVEEKGKSSSKPDWSKTCFVITPIGEDGSEQRRHSDLFLHSIIEPALSELGFEVVRADQIGAAGIITSQILEYVMNARLAIVDLSFHNPNAFYEMAIRHATRLPIVQISRKQDRLPFDVGQVRTVVIDTTDIYTLVPKLEIYKSEIAAQARAALGDGVEASNPITIFSSGFQIVPISKRTT